MAEQSHRDEMNAAIRAQRERSAVPKTIALEPPAEPVADTEPAPPTAEPTQRRLHRFRRK